MTDSELTIPAGPRVTVIVPLRNGAGVFEEAVHSVQRQQFPDWQLLLIDDGSDDASAAKSKELAVTDPRLRVLVNPVNEGLARTLNRGLGIVRGEFLLVLHQDCRLNGSDWFERSLLPMDDPACAVVAGRPVHDVERMSPQEKWFWVIRNHAYAVGPGPSASRRTPLFSENKCDVFRRSSLVEIGGFDESVGSGGEDQVLAFRLHQRGLRIVHPPDLLFTLTLGNTASVSRGLRRDLEYGRQMRRVLRRIGMGALRRDEGGRTDPRVANRVGGSLWVVLFALGGLLLALTGSWVYLPLIGLAPLTRSAQLGLRAVSCRPRYRLRARDVAAIALVGLVADLAYVLGGLTPGTSVKRVR